MSSTPDQTRPALAPNDLESYWVPFTPNKTFKANPKLLVSADGMYYKSQEGQEILDGTAGLWCVNAGHNNPHIVRAIQEQAATLDYGPAFQLSHPKAFELSNRLVGMAPKEYTHAFYTNSGSESADTALKMALAYHRARGEGGRTRLIGRERGYHGVNFGGMSVGGIVGNRKVFGHLLAGVDHIRHTLDLDRSRFTKGMPEHGVEFAEDLERLVALHDASTIAAVIVEPVSCSTGVLVPPKGYLKRLREICDKHGILLIFDEVITAFGRLGTNFAVDYFDVKADIITMAKGLTNGAVPMGAVLVRDGIFDTLAGVANGGIELFHGYTYSAHPLACAAALGTFDAYEEQDMFTKAGKLGEYLETRIHELQDAPNVADIRNIGFIAAVEMTSRPGAPGARAMEIFNRCYEKGVLIRVTGDIIALSPPFIADNGHIDRIVETLRECIEATA